MIADIIHQRDKPVALHFNGGDHNISNFRAVIIERIHQEGNVQADCREQMD